MPIAEPVTGSSGLGGNGGTMAGPTLRNVQVTLSSEPSWILAVPLATDTEVLFVGSRQVIASRV